MSGLQERLAAQSRAASRALALEAGSMLTAEPDRAYPDAVFVNAFPVLDWLLGGPDDDNDRLNRRRAVWRYRDDIRSAARAAGEPFTWPGPAEFMARAAQYYTVITGGNPR